MAQASKYENYSVEDLEKLATMNRPIAGQSLTNSPEQQYPWERPTKYNSVQPAIEAIFVELFSISQKMNVAPSHYFLSQFADKSVRGLHHYLGRSHLYSYNNMILWYFQVETIFALLQVASSIL